jgi:hypothetical protein
MAGHHQTAAVLRLQSDLRAIKTEPPDVRLLPLSTTLRTSVFPAETFHFFPLFFRGSSLRCVQRGSPL